MMEAERLIEFTLIHLGVDTIDSNVEIIYKEWLAKLAAENEAKAKEEAEDKARRIADMTYTYTKKNGKTCKMIGVEYMGSGIQIDFKGNYIREGGGYVRASNIIGIGATHTNIIQEVLAESTDADFVYTDLYGRNIKLTNDNLKAMIEYKQEKGETSKD